MNEDEIVGVINLNDNEIITLDEFVLFFLIKQTTIDNFPEEAIKRRSETFNKKKEEVVDIKNHCAGAIVDTTYDHFTSPKHTIKSQEYSANDEDHQNLVQEELNKK